MLTAVDLNAGTIRWNVVLGSLPEIRAATTTIWGTPDFGGPVVTAGGLVFIAATHDRTIRAFDVSTGAVVWQAPLPASATATPMTYEFGGRQYVVIVAGGNPRAGTKLSDAVVAFALS
jgi:quinoprotein glucose dehydrogenase